jgi:hypothetical protein
VTFTTARSSTNGTNDHAFTINNSATLRAGGAVHEDTLLRLRNNGTTIFDFYASGRMGVASAAAGSQPGFLFSDGNGGSLLMRLSGGTGNIVEFSSQNTTITEWYFGNCPATNCSMSLGPNAHGTSDIVIYKGTSGPAIQTNVGVRYARIALPTCNAGNEGMIVNDVAGGLSTGNATRLCACRSDGAGSPTYYWDNIITGTDGNTTTCAN